MSLEIIKAGPQTLVQDYGRYGLQHFGITNSGSMDEHAFLWANKLLDNHFNAPQLEICMGGFEARFTAPTTIAICGADCSATLNKNPIKNWQTACVRAGDVLRLPHMTSGLYSYLSVKNGFKVEPQLTSCATVAREYLGGLYQNGEKIKKHDVLTFLPKESCEIKPTRRSVPKQFINTYPKQIRVRFYPNATANKEEKLLIERFTQQTFVVSQNSNRMGYRLESNQALEHEISNRLSQGVSTGMIQLPQSGHPIVLMKDRQTIGGYPVLGCIVALDIPKLSQSKPNTVIQFSPTTIEECEPEYRQQLEFFSIMAK